MGKLTLVFGKVLDDSSTVVVKTVQGGLYLNNTTG